jgi:hypothetical protein
MNLDPLGETTGAVLSTNALLQATVAALPSSAVQSGALAWATNGRKSGEGAGLGTGVLVYADNQAGTVTWRRLSDDTTAAA